MEVVEAHATIESRNPVTGELLGSVEATPPDQINEVADRKSVV